MNAQAEKAGKVWTEAELEALPDDGCVHEIVSGELVMSPKNNFQHEYICERLNFALESFNRIHRLGAVFGSTIGFWMQNRNCRAPDVSFVRKERLVRLGLRPDTKTFFPGAPDLAVEVLSPGNSRAEMEGKLSDYFSSGAQTVWLFDPDEESVEIWHSRTDRRTIESRGIIEGEPVLPGFRLPVSDLFKD